jgi:hypothetical protein
MPVVILYLVDNTTVFATVAVTLGVTFCIYLTIEVSSIYNSYSTSEGDGSAGNPVDLMRTSHGQPCSPCTHLVTLWLWPGELSEHTQVSLGEGNYGEMSPAVARHQDEPLTIGRF